MATSKPRSILVAIVGGSGAGKSWLAEKLQDALGPAAVRISLDDFYRDRSHLPPARRALVNFDHPHAIDWATVRSVLQDCAAGRPCRVPCYDFKTHCRLRKLKSLKPAPIVLVDGLWLLHRTWLRRLFALKIFIDCPAQTRLRRRLARDLSSRGRTAASIKHQFRSAVEPMHQKHVAPQARHADLVLPNGCGDRDIRKTAALIAARSLRQTSTLSSAQGGLSEEHAL